MSCVPGSGHHPASSARLGNNFSACISKECMRSADIRNSGSINEIAGARLKPELHSEHGDVIRGQFLLRCNFNLEISHFVKRIVVPA